MSLVLAFNAHVDGTNSLMIMPMLIAARKRGGDKKNVFLRRAAAHELMEGEPLVYFDPALLRKATAIGRR